MNIDDVNETCIESNGVNTDDCLTRRPSQIDTRYAPYSEADSMKTRGCSPGKDIALRAKSRHPDHAPGKGLVRKSSRSRYREKKRSGVSSYISYISSGNRYDLYTI
jgi:hypothetical protein